MQVSVMVSLLIRDVQKLKFFLLIGTFGRLTFWVTVPRQRIPEP